MARVQSTAPFLTVTSRICIGYSSCKLLNSFVLSVATNFLLLTIVFNFLSFYLFIILPFFFCFSLNIGTVDALYICQIYHFCYFVMFIVLVDTVNIGLGQFYQVFFLAKQVNQNKPKAMEVVRRLIAEDGWKGFYRGLGPRFFSSSAWGTSMIVCYEYLSKSISFFSRCWYSSVLYVLFL